MKEIVKASKVLVLDFSGGIKTFLDYQRELHMKIAS